jgi:hypothetical protein
VTPSKKSANRRRLAAVRVWMSTASA